MLRPPRSRSVRTQQLIIMMGLLLPAFLYSGFLIANVAKSERSSYRQQALEAVQRIAADIDQELANHASVLTVLAVSPHLEQNDLKAFHEYSLAVKGIVNGEIILKDQSGQQLSNTRRSWGIALPSALTDADRAALQTSRTVVSDLFTSYLDAQRIISIAQPVRVGDRSAVITMAISPSRLVNILKGQLLPVDWTIAIVDANDKIIARSRLHESCFDTTVTPSFKQGTAGPYGSWSGTTQEGTQILGTFMRPQLAPGWRVSVGVPTASFDRPLRQSMNQLALLGLVTMAGAVLLASWHGERLSRGLGRLAGHVKNIGEGSNISLPLTHVREIDDIARASSLANNELNNRTKALEDKERRLRLALEAGRMGTWEWEFATGNVDLDAMACELWDADPARQGWQVEELFTRIDELDRASTRTIVENAITGRTPYRHEFRVRHRSGQVRWMRGRGVVIEDGEGKPSRMVGVNVDITARKQSDEKQALLLAELNHRVKNSLAVLEAIANRTMQDAASPEAFVQAFSGRLRALADAHTLLSETEWQGPDIKSLIEIQVRPYSGGSMDRIICAGPEIKLNPDLSLAIAFVLHELTTNAAKYGSLSVPEGRLDVTWDRIERDGRHFLDLSWVEKGGPPVGQPVRKGFGSKLIDESLEYSFNGEVIRQFEPGGVTAQITVPLI